MVRWTYMYEQFATTQKYQILFQKIANFDLVLEWLLLGLLTKLLLRYSCYEEQLMSCISHFC